jgi:hypothetical protein
MNNNVNSIRRYLALSDKAYEAYIDSLYKELVDSIFYTKSTYLPFLNKDKN